MALKVMYIILKQSNQPIKMASDKFMNLVFGSSMKVLELVKGRELDDVEPIGCDDFGLPLEKVFCLVACDLWYCGECVSKMRRCPFHAVAMIDLSLACLLVHTELYQHKLITTLIFNGIFHNMISKIDDRFVLSTTREIDRCLWFCKYDHWSSQNILR